MAIAQIWCVPVSKTPFIPDSWNVVIRSTTHLVLLPDFNLSAFSFQLCWGITDKTVGYLKHTTWWFDIHICCGRISEIKIINTFITSHSYLYSFCVWWECLRYTLRNLQVYSTVLSVIIIMLCFASSELVLLIAENVCPLTYISHYSSPGSGNYCSISFLWNRPLSLLLFFKIPHIRDPYNICLSLTCFP